MQIFTKQPSETLDYDCDFSQFFGTTDTDTFNGSTVLTVTIDQVLSGDLITSQSPLVIGGIGRVVKVWLKAGVTGRVYKVTLKCNPTLNGRVVELDFKVKVRDI